ncbi:MAG: METTL5 family protein [archaeon]
MTKKQLSITLSKLKVFSSPKIRLEQYPTDSNIAAEVIWFADLCKDIEGKVIADLGAGTGILGIGCLIMGAKKIIFVENDKDAIKVLKENLNELELENYEILNEDVSNFDQKVDTVIQNPPFGTKEKHMDRIFLHKAMNVAKTIYSFHKAETKDFIDKYIHESTFHATHYFEFEFPLKKSMEQHKKKVEKIKVGCWRIIKS